MHSETKKLGEMLVDAGLINAAQLQDALRHQRIAGGRMGSNLVALGFISEDVLMDFLAQQTGVPRIDLRTVDVPAEVLKRIPRRLADQLNVMPIGLKEPKSLVLAMADPSDLNAIDSSRFASGLNIEPVVVSYSQLRHAIPNQYRKLEVPGGSPIEIGRVLMAPEEGGLPVSFDASMPPAMVQHPARAQDAGKYAADPFFDPDARPEGGGGPLNFLTPELPAPPSRREAGAFIPARSAAQGTRRLETYQTRTLVLGLIKMLQRRGILGDDELQRYLGNLIEAGELKDDDRVG